MINNSEKISELENSMGTIQEFIDTLEVEILRARGLLQEAEEALANIVPSKTIMKKCDSYLDTLFEETTFIDLKISYSTMLKTFMKDSYNESYESWIEVQDFFYVSEDQEYFYEKDEINRIFSKIKNFLDTN